MPEGEAISALRDSLSLSCIFSFGRESLLEGRDSAIPSGGRWAYRIPSSKIRRFPHSLLGPLFLCLNVDRGGSGLSPNKRKGRCYNAFANFRVSGCSYNRIDASRSLGSNDGATRRVGEELIEGAETATTGVERAVKRLGEAMREVGKRIEAGQ